MLWLGVGRLYSISDGGSRFQFLRAVWFDFGSRNGRRSMQRSVAELRAEPGVEAAKNLRRLRCPVPHTACLLFVISQASDVSDNRFS